MKKILALLLVAVMTVSCFCGCNTMDPELPGASSLGDKLSSLVDKFGDADAIKEEANITLSITFDQPLFSEENLNEMMGEEGAMMLPILTPFIKNDMTVEIPVSVKGAFSASGNGSFEYVLGKGDSAFAFSGIMASGDIFVKISDVYAWASALMETIMGEALPAWSLENEYVSLMDIVALAQSMTEQEGAIEMGGVAVTTSDAMAESPVVEPGFAMGDLEALLGGLSPEMATAIGEALIEAIPEQSILDLIGIVESAMKNSGMLVEEDGYMVLRVNGDTIEKFPDAFSKAAKGKLGKAIDSIVNGIRNSDNEIIASMIPAEYEINGQQIETLLLAELSAAKESVESVAEMLKAMNYEIEFAAKLTDKGIQFKANVQCTISEDGLTGTIKLDANGFMEVANDVEIQAPNNVMTETELAEFIAGFMAGFEEGFVG